ncbi:MAG: 3-octaprenyl-4-hydroxybenzoate carboxy-lyase [Geobacteraceae bacterium]|nr:3-octaprenyl-4-hydroxybenzoate carboxy-lyase [Geobacteraceae bacterium]
MAYPDLHHFLDRLDQEGELQRVTVEVDPVLEISAIADRVSKMPGGGKALLFENVKDSQFPAAVNIFGSYRRTCLALGVEELNDLSGRVDDFFAALPAGSADEWWLNLGFEPRQVIQAQCREIIDYSPDLESYPFLKSWPEDSGRAATLPLVFTEDPETGRANCGMYRTQVLGPVTVAIHWSPGSGGGRHYSRYRESGRRMPVAIVLGGDPSLVFSAMLPLPDEADEMRFAGLLRNSPVEMVRSLTSSLLVPANAELVIEGFVESGEVVSGSVFGNHTGFYAPAPDAPIVRVTCVTRKSVPVFPSTVVGRPPMEDCWMAKACERLLLPFIRRAMPEVADINMPLEWIFHNSAVVAVDKAYPGHAVRVMDALRNGGWLRNARLLIVVDAGIDIQDLSLVAWRMLNCVDWQRDIVRFGQCREHAQPVRTLPGSGTFLGVDATRKLPEEHPGRAWPGEIAMNDDVTRLIEARWRAYGL